MLAFLDGSLFILLLSALINLTDENSIVNSAYYIAIVTLVIGALYLLGMVFIFIKTRKILGEQCVKDKYGYLWAELNIKKGSVVLLWPLFLTARVWLLSLSIILSQNFLVGQFLVFNACTVGVLFVLGMRPHLDSSMFRTEFLGETAILMVLDCLIISSDPVVEPDAREYIGWMMIAFLLLLILNSIVLSLYTTVCSAKLRCRKCLHNRKMKAKMAAAAEKRTMAPQAEGSTMPK